MRGQEGEYSRMEMGSGNWSGKHVILAYCQLTDCKS